MRSMRNRRTAATRSTTVTRLYAVGTGGHGNESATATPRSTHFVRSVTGKGCCIRWKRYTTSCRWQRAALMMRATSCHCASPAMQGFMQSVVTDGININLFYANHCCGDFSYPVGGGQISTADILWNGRGVSRIKTGNQTGDCPALIFHIS